MYAIIVDGGRQYRVEPGMEVDVDYRDVAQGENVTFEKDGETISLSFTNDEEDFE